MCSLFKKLLREACKSEVQANKRAWRAFLKRPENFSGPKTFQGSFRVNFLGPGKRFSMHPKTPWILTRVFRVVFSGLQRELDSDLFKHGAILYNKAEVFSLSIRNPNGQPMLQFTLVNF